MNLVQKWPFFQLFQFQAVWARKMFFTIFWKGKSPFQAIAGAYQMEAIETRLSKSRNIDIFQKGLTQGLVQKWPFFKLFFFQAIKGRKMSFTIFWKGKLPFQAIKTKTSKSRNIDIFQIKGLTHGSGPKMAIFLFCFFLANIGQENVLYDILDRKIAFLGYKKKNLKSQKIDIFSKG